MRYAYASFPQDTSVTIDLFSSAFGISLNGTGASVVPAGPLAEITMFVFIFLPFVHNP